MLWGRGKKNKKKMEMGEKKKMREEKNSGP